jgi:hypothetical protein
MKRFTNAKCEIISMTPSAALEVASRKSQVAGKYPPRNYSKSNQYADERWKSICVVVPRFY